MCNIIFQLFALDEYHEDIRANRITAVSNALIPLLPICQQGNM